MLLIYSTHAETFEKYKNILLRTILSPTIFFFQFLLNLLELLKNFPFVKAKNLTPYKAKVLEDIREAVEEMNLIKAGKLEARDAEELFREL